MVADPELGTPMGAMKTPRMPPPHEDDSDWEPLSPRGRSREDPLYVKHSLLSGPLTLIAFTAAIYLLVFLKDVLVTVTFAIFMM